MTGKKVQWSSSDDMVLSVRSDGLAVGHAPGKVTIYLDVGQNAKTSTEVSKQRRRTVSTY